MNRLLPAVAAIALVASGCGGTSIASAKPPAIQEYVALGDSYTAAPYVPLTDVAGGCLRSDSNYPALVAKALKVKNLIDVSCSGASSADLVNPKANQLGTIAPQFSALTPKTELVTLSIGGNDGNLYGNLFLLCQQGKTCNLAEKRAGLVDQVGQLRTTLAASLATIKTRSPKAKVLVVGYPRIAPDAGCAAFPVMTEADLVVANEINKLLSDVMADAAKGAEVAFIDVYAASLGHDVCSKDPWVNGVVTDTSRAAALHPFPEEQQAVAKLIEDNLTKSPNRD